MMLTVEQINQLHTLLQEHPSTTHVSVTRTGSGASFLAAGHRAHFIEWNGFPFGKPETLETYDITDKGTF